MVPVVESGAHIVAVSVKWFSWHTHRGRAIDTNARHGPFLNNTGPESNKLIKLFRKIKVERRPAAPIFIIGVKLMWDPPFFCMNDSSKHIQLPTQCPQPRLGEKQNNHIYTTRESCHNKTKSCFVLWM